MTKQEENIKLITYANQWLTERFICPRLQLINLKDFSSKTQISSLKPRNKNIRFTYLRYYSNACAMSPLCMILSSTALSIINLWALLLRKFNVVQYYNQYKLHINLLTVCILILIFYRQQRNKKCRILRNCGHRRHTYKQHLPIRQIEQFGVPSSALALTAEPTEDYNWLQLRVT